MIRYLARLADGCWHWVTTDPATWARLPHVATVTAAAALGCGVIAAIPPKAPERAPAPVLVPRPAPPSDARFYYPPGWDQPSQPPEAVPPSAYLPPVAVAVPEPTGWAVFVIGAGAVVLLRQNRSASGFAARSRRTLPAYVQSNSASA